MHIRPATQADWTSIWKIIAPVIRQGETYALDPDMSEETARLYWLGEDKHPFVAVDGEEVLGTYYLKTNQAGGGAHVCNCGYMTAAHATGRGVARAMCEHSLAYAKDAGYRAMQFNFVVSTNVRAVALWERFGFDIVGRLPAAFAHPELGYVDALIMYKALV